MFQIIADQQSPSVAFVAPFIINQHGKNRRIKLVYYKRNFVICFFLVVFILFTFRAGASLAIGPPSYEVQFESGLEQTFAFNILTDDADREFEISLEGDLAQYARLSSAKVKGTSQVSVFLKLPSYTEKPGKHVIYFSAREILKPEEQQSTISVVTNVKGMIIVYIPYPGKYAELVFNAADANSGEPVIFNLKIYSRGNEEITTNSKIEIYDAGRFGEEETKLSPVLEALLAPSRTLGNLVDTIELGQDIIPSGQFVEINAEQETGNYLSGNYRAVAVVEYDGQITREEKNFRLGELFVDIIDWSDEVKKNAISSVIIEVESFWNEPIENVYIIGNVLGYNISFQTPSISSLGSWQKQKLIGHFDTTGIKENNFQVKLAAHYEGKTTEKIIDLHFARETDYVFIVLIVVLVLAGGFFIYVLIEFFLLKRKKHVGKKKI